MGFDRIFFQILSHHFCSAKSINKSIDLSGYKTSVFNSCPVIPIIESNAILRLDFNSS